MEEAENEPIELKLGRGLHQARHLERTLSNLLMSAPVLTHTYVRNSDRSHLFTQLDSGGDCALVCHGTHTWSEKTCVLCLSPRKVCHTKPVILACGRWNQEAWELKLKTAWNAERLTGPLGHQETLSQSK